MNYKIGLLLIVLCLGFASQAVAEHDPHQSLETRHRARYGKKKGNGVYVNQYNGTTYVGIEPRQGTFRGRINFHDKKEVTKIKIDDQNLSKRIRVSMDIESDIFAELPKKKGGNGGSEFVLVDIEEKTNRRSKPERDIENDPKAFARIIYPEKDRMTDVSLDIKTGNITTYLSK